MSTSNDRYAGTHALPIREPIVLPSTLQQSRATEVRRRRLAMVALVTAVVIAGLLHFGHRIFSIDRSRLTIATVERDSFTYDVAASGQVVAAGGLTLNTPAAGTVTLNVRAGDSVVKGQQLAAVDSPDLVAKLSQEEATLDSLRIEWRRSQLQAAQRLSQLREALSRAEVDQKTARRELERSRKAYELGAFSELQALRAQDALDKAQFADSQAKMNYADQPKENRFDIDSRKALFDRQQYLVSELRRQVASLYIHSSVNGKVSRMLVANSATVTKDVPLLTVVDLSALEVEIKIPEDIARNITSGMTVDLAGDSRTWKGSISGVSPEVVGGQVVVRARFSDDEPEGLYQGQRLSARVFIDRRDNVLMIDRGTLAGQQGDDFVYVVHGNVAERRPARLGAIGVRKVEILDGVTQGEQVVISGFDTFRGAARVNLGH